MLTVLTLIQELSLPLPQDMERVKLSKNEKKVMRCIASEGRCADSFQAEIYSRCARSLERKGLVKGGYIEGGEAESARLTPDGRDHLAVNPNLTNPINRGMIIIIAIAAVMLGCITYSKL